MSNKPDLELALIQSELAWQDPAANRAHFQLCWSRPEVPT